MVAVMKPEASDEILAEEGEGQLHRVIKIYEILNRENFSPAPSLVLFAYNALKARYRGDVFMCVMLRHLNDEQQALRRYDKVEIEESKDELFIIPDFGNRYMNGDLLGNPKTLLVACADDAEQSIKLTENQGKVGRSVVILPHFVDEEQLARINEISRSNPEATFIVKTEEKMQGDDRPYNSLAVIQNGRIVETNQKMRLSEGEKHQFRPSAVQYPTPYALKGTILSSQSRYDQIYPYFPKSIQNVLNKIREYY